MGDPLNPSNRKSPRIEVYAQAEVRGKDISIMAVRNVSAGGVYLEGTPGEYPDLKPADIRAALAHELGEKHAAA